VIVNGCQNRSGRSQIAECVKSQLVCIHFIVFDAIILQSDGLRLWQVGRRDVCVDRVAEYHEEFQVRIIHIRNRRIRCKFAAPVTARPEGEASVRCQVGGGAKLAGCRFTSSVGNATVILSVRLQPGHLSLHGNQGVTLRHGFRCHDLREGDIRFIDR